MSVDGNKAIVQRLYDELFNRGYAAVADELVGADFVDHGAAPGTPRGPAGMRLAVARLRAAVPDGRYVLEDLIGEDDRVAARVTVVGSRRASDAEEAAGGGRVTQAQMHVVRLIGGQVIDLWAVQDEVVFPLQGSDHTTGGPEVVLVTARVALRRFTASDLDNLVALDSDPAVMRFVNGGTPTPRTVIEHEVLPAFVRDDGAYGFWAAIGRSGGDLLGWFHLRPTAEGGAGEVELGYRLRRAAWGRGYATEGSRALIRLGFTTLGARRVVASTDAAHTASRRVLEKVGLRPVRIFSAPWPELPDGPAQDAVEYALSRAEWEAMP